MNQDLEILNQKILDLPFSDELKNILHEHDHQSLHDVLAVPVKKWKAYYNFNYHHLKEMADYVQENGLAEYLKH